MTIRRWEWTAILALVNNVCLSSGCLGTDRPATPAGIHIGAILPYTGDLASSGPSLEQGIIMAVEATNRGGGIAGQRLVLDVQDTHTDLVRGRAAFDRLVANGAAALVGPEEIILARDLAPDLEARNALMISGGISARAEMGAAPSLWLRIFPSAKTVTAELATRMINDGVRTTSLLFVDDSYGVTFASFFATKYQALGGKIVDSLPLPENASSLSFPGGMPPSLVLVAYPRAAALVVEQVAASGFRDRWYFGPSLDSEEFVLNTSPGLLDGMVGISPALTADSAQFTADFEARWEGNEPSLGSNFYYDSVAVLSLALQEAYTRLGRHPNADELAVSVRAVSGPPGQTVTWRELDLGLASLASGSAVNYRGISGPIDFDTDGDVAQGLVRFWHIGDGTIVRE